MSKDNITLIVGAKDLASGVLGRVRASTVALGTAAGVLLARGVTGAMNAVRGMVSAVLEAERANVMLDAALRGAGQYTPQLAQQYRDLAAAIQNETGASDESVKSNIAQLTTLGVSEEMMGESARAVSALAAIGRDGSLALVAVARAAEGDITAFERFSPEVRQATTLTEKYAAVNKLLAAGYAQQRANLQTVGGAWAALKGRIGDAVEDIGNAITQGLQLGQTFDNMQAAVGRFLQSDTFKAFTDRLRDGANYVSQIITAMGTDGGTKEVAAALGNVILAALKDGADYVANKISSAFGRDRLDDFDPRLAAASRFWGAKSGGASWNEAFAAMDKPKNQPKGGGNLDAALKKLSEIVERRVETAQTVQAAEQVIHREVEKQAAVFLDSSKAIEKQKQEADTRAQIEANITAAQKQVEDAVNRERSAADAAATAAEKRAKLAKMGIAEWLRNLGQGRADDDAKDKEDSAVMKKRALLMGRIGAKPGDDVDQAIEDAGKRGKRLSKADEQFLRDVQTKADEEAKAKAQEIKALFEASQAKLNSQAAQERLESIQKEQLNEIKGLRADLRENSVVQ